MLSSCIDNKLVVVLPVIVYKIVLSMLKHTSQFTVLLSLLFS